MAAKTQLQKILELAGQFVTARKCVWGHAEWEEFLEQVAALGIEITDESERNLGNILESCKGFYSEAETPVKKTLARSRKKA